MQVSATARGPPRGVAFGGTALATLARPEAHTHMTTGGSMKAIILAGVLMGATSSLADAQPRAEVGASLVNAVVGLGDNSVSTLGVPSGGFGILNPGAFASFFVGPRLAIEPQLGLVWASFDGESEHLLNLVGQVDYFLRGSDDASPYVFAAAGIVNVSDADYTPKSLGFGAGYRVPMGGRLTFRVDGRYTHFTGQFDGDGSDMLAFTLSIGGLFGQR
jgi:hypothetical protein